MPTTFVLAPTTFVLAGSYYEFISLFPSHGREWVYISSVDTLRGIRCGWFTKRGTWYRRPDIDDIVRQLYISEMTEIPPTRMRSDEDTIWDRYNETLRGYRVNPWLVDEPNNESDSTLKNEDDKYFYRIGYRP